MKPKKSTKSSDDIVKLIAGVILAISSIVGVVFTFLNIVDLSATRKVLVGLIVFVALIILEYIIRQEEKEKASR